MKLKMAHWTGIVAGLLLMVVDFLLFLGKNGNLFLFFFGIAVVIIILPFLLSLIVRNKNEERMNEMFLEFSRNLSESVNTGTPISKSIINIKKKNYGPLSPFVEKLANQISVGIPVEQAFRNF